MNRPKIKICGLRRREDISYVNEAMPDFAGFIFDSSRRRFIEPEKAAGLVSGLDSRIRSVGVFVNAPEEYILETARTVGFDVIQLHGSESPAYISHLKTASGLPVIDARRVSTADDVSSACQSPADMILLDNGGGGTGKVFDWSLVSDVPRDFILAGGISPDNVSAAIGACKPWGVDVSSSLETDGYKDRNKIIRFIEKVNS